MQHQTFWAVNVPLKAYFTHNLPQLTKCLTVCLHTVSNAQTLVNSDLLIKDHSVLLSCYFDDCVHSLISTLYG